MIAAAALALALAFSPFTAEEEHVREGNERLLGGDAEGALTRYDDAERAVGARPEIDFDRAHAAVRLGQGEDAKDRLRRAAGAAPAPLASRALQNLGHVLAGEGDRAGAIEAYSAALRKDPRNEDARHDLEVLLRRAEAEAERRRSPAKGGDETSGGGDGGDPSGGGGAADERGGPPGGDPAAAPRPAEAGAPGQTGARKPEGSEARGGGEQGAPGEAARSRQRAEALLDALREREQKLPLAGRARKGGEGGGDAAKDW